MTPGKKSNPLFELLINIVIPSVILMKFSGEQDLGAVGGLLVALAFPLGWGAIELLGRGKINFFSVLGLVSILLTGGIGLLQLDTQWLAVKEAAIPGLIGLAVLISTRTRYPLVKTLLYSPALIDVARVQQQLETRGTVRDFELRLRNATYMLGGTFFFSAAMNYFLATWIVTSPAGSEAFNAELGRLTLLSYPMIALPSMLMMMAALYYLGRAMRELAGLKLTEALNAGGNPGDDRP
jgi:intracellular septation protein A